jgi:hypothetical protein
MRVAIASALGWSAVSRHHPRSSTCAQRASSERRCLTQNVAHASRGKERLADDEFPRRSRVHSAVLGCHLDIIRDFAQIGRGCIYEFHRSE